MRAIRQPPYLRKKGTPHVLLVGHLAGEQLFGAERSLLGILAAIDRKTFEVSCVLPAQSDRYIAEIERFTNRITICKYGWWNESQSPEAVKEFESILRREAVDLIHVNTITLTGPLLAAKRVGVPSVVHARELINEDSYLQEVLGSGASDVVQTVCSLCDCIIANSNATHQIYSGAKKCFCLYNCVDAECFEMPTVLVPGKLRIGLVSSNHPKKGIERFARVAIASRSLPELEFLLIGPLNEYASALQRLVLSESANLRFVDYVSHPVEALRQLDVVVNLSTVGESFGRTIAEGMAAGRAVLAYDSGALPEIVRHGVDGFLVPVGCQTEVVQRLKQLLNEPEMVLKMGKNGRERAREMFSPHVFRLQLNRIYEELIGGRPLGNWAGR